MPYDFLNRSHAGPGLKAVILDANGDQILGRGNNVTWNDNFEIYPVDEYAKDGIDEFVAGRMGAGNGSIGTLFIASIQDSLPARDTFVNAGPFTMQILVADDRPNAGTILGQFEDVYFTVVGGSFSATGLAAQNVTFVYGKRIPGARIQGTEYPVQ